MSSSNCKTCKIICVMDALPLLMFGGIFLLWKDTNYVRTIHEQQAYLVGQFLSMTLFVQFVMCFTSVLKCSAHVTRIICQYIKKIKKLIHNLQREIKTLTKRTWLLPIYITRSGSARCCQPDTTAGSSELWWNLSGDSILCGKPLFLRY